MYSHHSPYEPKKSNTLIDHLFASIIGVLAIAAVMYFCYKLVEPSILVTVKTTGTVLEHNVTSDRDGIRTYSTIIKTDKGEIVEVTNLQTYVIPVGKRVNVNVRRRKADL